MRWFVAIILAQCLLLHACCLGRLPLGIEPTFADGSAKSWRFLRGPDVSGTLAGAGGARGVLAVPEASGPRRKHACTSKHTPKIIDMNQRTG